MKPGDFQKCNFVHQYFLLYYSMKEKKNSVRFLKNHKILKKNKDTKNI